jgi:hypothetical protein
VIVQAALLLEHVVDLVGEYLARHPQVRIVVVAPQLRGVQQLDVLGGDR